jgi:hypothetical protein
MSKKFFQSAVLLAIVLSVLLMGCSAPQAGTPVEKPAESLPATSTEQSAVSSPAISSEYVPGADPMHLKSNECSRFWTDSAKSSVVEVCNKEGSPTIQKRLNTNRTDVCWLDSGETPLLCKVGTLCAMKGVSAESDDSGNVVVSTVALLPIQKGEFCYDDNRSK